MSYSPPYFLFNAHLETIYPALIRRVSLPDYHRERIQTPDNDFLDLDWLVQSSRKLVIISHGLEGNSSRAYIKGMARALFRQGFDVLAWNYRGCSGEMNRQLRFYHSGATDDLDTVVAHVLKLNRHDAIHLVGFSLGGNLTLKYLGEQRTRSALLKRAVAFSTPLDLYTSCQEISKPSNWIYSKRFLASLRKKVLEKSKVLPGLDIRSLSKVKTLMEFDDYFTGPVHGFNNARDYYDKCSSLQFLHGIQLPVLIINAWNDPFLSKSCYPEDQLKNHSVIQFETPDYGGHVGFTQFNKNGLYWSEQRALDFLTSHD